ncbi:MAG: ABC transporter ATP-binding protein, partial [Propionibacteriaceae bacterium]|nr:ABC transporter ATP-binding protein [Propionibacteriaceae bacterium]
MRESMAGALRGLRTSIQRTAADEFWALRDVDFALDQGDRLGIIGRNGAGKSTLLKLLSRITEPTTGEIRMRGRVASLLEVGTGFHPELTGRENILLNGAILGMRRAEIRRKFDEIVAFAEVERFLDTPVKRYSSGMYVRLAFAVAAHLEPEILIVDEVLAVGDMQFQKKCLGKMREVGLGGRTVLFVSHNMSVISSLCNKGLLLDAGRVKFSGGIDPAIDQYLSVSGSDATVDLSRLPRSAPCEFSFLERLSLADGEGRPTNMFVMGDKMVCRIRLTCRKFMRNAEVGLRVSSRFGSPIHYLTSTWEGLEVDLEPGEHEFEVVVPDIRLFPGTYSLGAWVLTKGYGSDDNVSDVTTISVASSDFSWHGPTFDIYARCFQE